MQIFSVFIKIWSTFEIDKYYLQSNIHLGLDLGYEILKIDSLFLVHRLHGSLNKHKSPIIP